MTKTIPLRVDGNHHVVDADPAMPLLYALRDDLALDNPRFGCGLAQCGACTVLLDGTAIRSCVYPVGSAAGHEVTTLGGWARPRSRIRCKPRSPTNKRCSAATASTAGS